MPASPALNTAIVSGSTGHIADSNKIAALLNDIFKMPLVAAKTAAFTLGQDDTGSTIPVNSAAGVPVTLPVLQAGTRVRFLRQGTGAVTFVGSGTTLSGPSGATLTPRVQGSIIEIVYLTTTDVRFSGDLTGSGGGAVTTVERSRYTGSATMALADGGKVVDVDASAPATFTVPPRDTVAFPEGTVSEICAIGTGQVTIAPGAGVQFIPSGSWKLRAQGSGAKIRALPIGDASLPATGLLFRLNGDDATVTNGTVNLWPESSGNGHPSAAQPTVTNQPTKVANVANGHSAVQFDGVDNYMTLSGTALSILRNRASAGIFICYRYPTAVTGTRTLFALSGGTVTTQARAIMYHRDSAGVLGGGGRRVDADTGQFLSGTGFPSVAGAVEVLSAEFLWSAAQLRFYKDGTQIASTSAFQTAGSTSDTAALAGVVGANLAGAAEFTNCQILEILVYDNGTTATRANVHTYFESKYGAVTVDGNGATGDVWNIQGDIVA